MKRDLRAPRPPDESGAVIETVPFVRARGRSLAALAFLFFALPLPGAETENYDVIIYGGSSAGVIAAVQAAVMGKSTLLIAETPHLGGMTASGLGTADVGQAETIGGLAQKFYDYVDHYYSPPTGENAQGVTNATAMQFQLEPHVAEAVFTAMLKGAGAAWTCGERLDRSSGVILADNRIAQLRMKSGRTFSGRVFIDATYEGDLLAAAGVHYSVGRESRAAFGESLAGVQRNLELTGEVDAYCMPQQPWSGLLPGIAPQAPETDGTADTRVQQYNFRLCMTNAPENRLTIARPDDYNRSAYELLARNLQQHNGWQLTDVCKVQPLPGQKADINATGSFSTDMAGDGSWRLAEADDAERAAILAQYRDYTQGLFWFLANDAAVPLRIREQATQWGLAKDEFADTGNWPWQLYVREARRMIGSYIVTQHDCDGENVVTDPVALGSYAIDSHKVTLFVDQGGALNTEGFFFHPVQPYRISYRAIVPRRDECANLLVPVCLSATHVAFNSIRMEPVFMMLGQAAGTAASLAIDQGTTVQDVNYATLARELRADGQILTWPNVEPLPPIGFRPRFARQSVRADMEP